MSYQFYSSTDLVERLCYAANEGERRVTFLVGSALSLPDTLSGHGVPGVSGIIDLIRGEFKDEKNQIEQSLTADITNQYQEAFKFLHARRGQDAANRIVRTAVWQALDAENFPAIFR